MREMVRLDVLRRTHNTDMHLKYFINVLMVLVPLCSAKVLLTC